MVNVPSSQEYADHKFTEIKVASGTDVNSRYFVVFIVDVE